MKKNVFKTLGLSLLTASSIFTTTAFAAEKKSETEKIEVTPTLEGVTPQELAAIYVLSEICPDLIGRDLKFNKAYDNLVKSYLSNESVPQLKSSKHLWLKNVKMPRLHPKMIIAKFVMMFGIIIPSN